MILNYLKVAMRYLLKNKLYLAINVLGMGIAIACAMTAYLLVAYNIEFDSSVDKDQVRNIVKVLHHRTEANADPYQELVAPLPLAPAAAHDIAGIRNYTRFCSNGGYISREDKGFHETIFFADAAFLTMFKPALVSGSYENFKEKNSIFLSQKFASKYFDTEDPIGKEVTIYANNKLKVAIVGGVLKDAPFNSTFTENVLMPIEWMLDTYNVDDNDWKSNATASTLFELNDIAALATVEEQFTKYVALRNQANEDARSVQYQLVPFFQYTSPNDIRESDLHLPVPPIALITFSSMGIIILLIACFNLTNTTLALSMKRLKEIGVRKVVGSARLQIVLQFLIEISVTITLAVLFGFSLSLFFIPEFAAMWQLPYGLKELNNSNFLVALLTLLFLSSLLAGVYPAVFASSMNPVLLFRGAKKAGGTNFLTRTLLVAQFSLSTIVLIAGTMFIRNADYQDTISFGYDKDLIITATTESSQDVEALQNAIASNSKIEKTAASNHHFATHNGPERPSKINGEKFEAAVYDVSPEYFSTVGLQLVSGKIFGDLDSMSIVVDENFVRRQGLSDPLGTKVEIADRVYSIVGVVTNHITNLKSSNDRTYAYRLAKPDDYQVLVVRAEAGSLIETKNFIDQEWKKLFPGKPLRTDVQRDIIYLEANAYNQNLSKIFLFLTVLGCLLSVSGLYSMATLNISKRTKEIGIRKVLGASVANILRLINTEFAVILLIAAILGGIGGFAMSDGLLGSLYRQRITIGVLPVILCSSFIFLVGILSTSFTILNTAKENPVKALKE
ncbi:MAG TPA: ABC transporter permease [Cyclobacteriaceae bacterium]|nr:ABC transporter permease [Cyclobacteriaceae bacterium]